MWAAIEKSTFLQHYRYTCSIHLHLNLVVARGSNVFMGDDSNFQNKNTPDPFVRQTWGRPRAPTHVVDCYLKGPCMGSLVDSMQTYYTCIHVVGLSHHGSLSCRLLTSVLSHTVRVSPGVTHPDPVMGPGLFIGGPCIYSPITLSSTDVWGSL